MAPGRNFKEIKAVMNKKEKKHDKKIEDEAYYVDPTRNCSVFLEKTDSKKERIIDDTVCLNSMFYLKQAKHSMGKKQYEKALSYLGIALDLLDGDDEDTEDVVVGIRDNNSIYI